MILKASTLRSFMTIGLVSILYVGLNICLSASENSIGPLQQNLMGTWQQTFDGKDAWSVKTKIVLIFHPNRKFDFTLYKGLIIKREFTSEYNINEDKRILTLEQRETRIKPFPLDENLALMERHQEWVDYRIVSLKDRKLVLKMTSERGKNFEGEYRKVK